MQNQRVLRVGYADIPGAPQYRLWLACGHIVSVARGPAGCARPPTHWRCVECASQPRKEVAHVPGSV